MFPCPELSIHQVNAMAAVRDYNVKPNLGEKNSLPQYLLAGRIGLRCPAQLTLALAVASQTTRPCRPSRVLW